MILTRRQKELLDYLGDFIERKGYAPTLEEIGEHFGLTSLATVHKHLSNLVEKGLIKRQENMSRAIEIVEQERPARAAQLPLLGRVAAGAPIEAIEDADSIEVPRSLLRAGQSNFALRVVGDSMIEDGILDGDFIVVESRDTASSGETVVATIEGEATVKRFYRERGGQVRLEPANRRLSPIHVRGRDLQIRGVVRGVFRRYGDPKAAR